MARSTLLHRGAFRRLPTAEAVYQAAVAGLLRGSGRLTGIVQNGSLPAYLCVILATAVLVPGGALIANGAWPEADRFSDGPLQAAVAARRFVAVLFLGAVGFGVAVFFVLYGAPDLALTQLLVETLTLVIFVLVLRHLPDRFREPDRRGRRALRLGVSLAVGLFVACFSLIATSARTSDPISAAHIERALPDAGGRNVVNVILVDFRGFDTLGEVTVLAVAAMGIGSLLAAGRRRPAWRQTGR